MKTNEVTGDPEQDDEATFRDCQGCHSAFSGKWRIPPATLSFVGKDAFSLCKLERDFFFNASDFIGHIEHDALIREAFTGRMGLNVVQRGEQSERAAQDTLRQAGVA
jgi:hypothetical protein